MLKEDPKQSLFPTAMRHTIAALAALLCVLAAVHASDAIDMITALEGLHPSAFFDAVSDGMHKQYPGTA